uniref:Uncharacterized protein n=1 Tax=Zea mays TaxID=4577 RepID=A0A804UBN5_MAIZE
MGTASERRPMSGLATMGRLAEAWRICSEEAATPMPSLRKKLTPSHGKSRKPCTQNPTPITSRRLAAVAAPSITCFSSSMTGPRTPPVVRVQIQILIPSRRLCSSRSNRRTDCEVAVAPSGFSHPRRSSGSTIRRGGEHASGGRRRGRRSAPPNRHHAWA